MTTVPELRELDTLLPGTWAVAASNLPLWLDGERREPGCTFEVVSTDPLVVSDDIVFTTPEGEERHVAGTSTLRTDGRFKRRGSGRRRFLSATWSVSGASEDGTIMAIRYAASRVVPEGIDIVVREGSHYPELRAMIAHTTTDYGLSPEDFGSLTWFVTPGEHRQ